MADSEGGHSFELLRGDPPLGLTCLICRLVAQEPYQTGCCGKLFCKTCLTRWLHQRNTCPHCQQELPVDGIFRDVRAAQEIGDLAIYCLHKNDGCEWTGELRLIKGHLRGCVHEEQQSRENHYSPHPTEEKVEHEVSPSLDIVECEQCGEDVQRSQLSNHLSESCLQRQYKCPRCQAVGVYQDITTDHLQHCSNLKLPCPNEGCSELICINKIEEHLRQCTGAATS